MKRWLVLLALLVPLIAACGTTLPIAPDPTPTPSSPNGSLTIDRARLSDELNLYNWTEYIDPQILADFEAEYGVRVNLDLYESNTEMLDGIRTGTTTYDIAVPSDEFIPPMIAAKLLAPLDKTLLPNLQYQNPDLLDQYFDPGNTYSVPYFWGTTGIAYNQKYFAEPPDSWAVVFEPAQLDQLDGRFVMLDVPRELAEAALLYLGVSINEFTPADIATVEQLLQAQQPYVAGYTSTDTDDLLASEEIILAHTWSGTAGQAMAGSDELLGNPDIRYLIPQEGGTIWQDNLVILASSPHQYTAHVFINYLMRPDVAARNADWVLYLTPNLAAYPILTKETLTIYNTGLLPDPADMERLQWTNRTPEADRLIDQISLRLVAP